MSLRRAIDGKWTVCIVEKYSIMSDHIVNWYTHTDFYHFLQWKKNIYYTSHTHGPIYTFYHAPQIDDNLHKYISQGASAFHEYPYSNQTLISCFCYIPSCYGMLWTWTILFYFLFFFLILLFFFFIFFFFGDDEKGMWQGSHMTGHMIWHHRPRIW